MLPEDEQAEIARRRTICADCPFNSSNAVKELLYKTGRFDEHCVLCGCTISRKTAALTEDCGMTCCNAKPTHDCNCKNEGLKQFNTENNINAPLKWVAYKKENDE